MQKSTPRSLWIRGVLLATTMLPVLHGVAAESGNDADWPTFGGDNRRTNANLAPTRITKANIKTMVRKQVTISAPIDAGLIYLHGVEAAGATRDVYFGTTNLGHTIAIDANEARVLWEFTPPDFDEAAALNPQRGPSNPVGAKQITNSTPVADANRKYIYAAAADGKVTKLAIADGKVIWSTAVTKLPKIEKLASPLSFVDGHILAPTGGYVGDAGTYQGHIAMLNAETGAIEHVWNSLCSDRLELMDPASCPQVQSAIWARAGIVIDPATGNLLFATGNGPYDGKTHWADALLMLNPTMTQLLGNWTPTNNEELRARDLDVGSTAPVLLGDGYIAQGGKDGTIRLLTMDLIKGSESHRGGELQVVPTPGNSQLLSASATTRINDVTYLFVSQVRGGTVAWTFGNDHKLKEAWKDAVGGTSPFYAGGLVYIYTYDQQGGRIRVHDATTGEAVATLDCGSGHWNSVIVADNRIALPDGAIQGFGGFGGFGRGPNQGPAAPMTAPKGNVNIWSLP